MADFAEEKSQRQRVRPHFAFCSSLARQPPVCAQARRKCPPSLSYYFAEKREQAVTALVLVATLIFF